MTMGGSTRVVYTGRTHGY